MLKGGSLLYAIFVMCILTTITGFLIVAFSFYNRYIDDWYLSVKANDNINSALNCVLADYKSFVSADTIKFNPENKEEGVASISMVCWGGFLDCKINSIGRNKSEVSLLLGAQNNNSEPLALWLLAKGSKLNVSGKTSIKGNCYLPFANIGTTVIDGENYKGGELVQGEIKSSLSALPEINNDIIQFASSYLQGNYKTTDSVIFAQDIRVDSLINSFGKKTWIIDAPDEYEIKNIGLRGRIIVRSAKKITVSSSAKLNNIIIVAPEVYIGENVKGCFQVFAGKTVELAKNVCLDYPSFICVTSNNQNNDLGLVIGERSKLVGGALLYLDGFKKDDKKAIVNIKNEALVEGLVYSSEDLQLTGAVYGSVYCSRLLLETQASIYSNTLLNASIDATRLPDFFLFPFVLSAGKANVLLWAN